MSKNETLNLDRESNVGAPCQETGGRVPGQLLAQEVELICNELEIESVNKTRMSKSSYRRKLVAACHKKNEEKIKSESEGKVKCERILAEVYGRKSYINDEQINHVRETYKARFGLLSFAGNYKNDKRFSGNGGLCKCNRAIEDEPHLLSGTCKVYGDIRSKYGDLRDDQSLVRFFTEVLEKREALDEEDKNK